MKKLLLISGLLLSFHSDAQIDISRTVFGAAGTELSNTNLQLSFTIGETFTASLTNAEIHTLGFQQSDRSAVSIDEFSAVDIGLYPNPADDQITFVSSLEGPFTYKVFDVTGRIVLEGSHQHALLKLDVSHLVRGKYFFEYTSEKQSPITTAFIIIR